jgi:NAD(P)-dependent dehydrogenase (short-subunit alcohol dehydrogenase family)
MLDRQECCRRESRSSRPRKLFHKGLNASVGDNINGTLEAHGHYFRNRGRVSCQSTTRQRLIQVRNSRCRDRPQKWILGRTMEKPATRALADLGMKAVITGGDSGIGRAVAIAYAREGADVLIAYLSENEDANDVKALIEKEGRKAVLVAGDLQDPNHCRLVIKRAVEELGGVDILVNNAAHQATFKDIGDISDQEWDMTFKVNIHAMFYLTKAAVPHMKPGSAIVNTASINSDIPNPILLAYATTKGAIQNFTGGLAQLLAEKGIRANAVAPGPIWTPLIPSTMPQDTVKTLESRFP